MYIYTVHITETTIKVKVVWKILFHISSKVNPTLIN